VIGLLFHSVDLDKIDSNSVSYEPRNFINLPVKNGSGYTDGSPAFVAGEISEIPICHAGAASGLQGGATKAAATHDNPS
jgi:hypothetical protein